MHGKTVAALSTPRGKGGVAMIRVSGEDAFSVASEVFKPAGNKGSLGDYPSKTAVYGRFYDGENAFDDGIAILYRSPPLIPGKTWRNCAATGGFW